MSLRDKAPVNFPKALGLGLVVSAVWVLGAAGEPGPLPASGQTSLQPASPAQEHPAAPGRKQSTGQGRDWLGEEELAGTGDPSFASVSRHFPAMKQPREALGAKESLQECVVLPDGSLNLGGVKASFAIGTPPVSFGQGGCAKRLYRGCLPIVIADAESDGLRCEETAFGWSPGLGPDTPLFALARLTISNSVEKSRTVGVQLVAPTPVCIWEVAVPGHDSRSVFVSVPFTKPASATKIAAKEFEERLAETADWWNKLLSAGISIQVPEERVDRAWRAWLAYNFINVHKRGEVYEPHDGGGGAYESVFGYSAARYCYALDLMGFPQEAGRYLQSLLTFAKPDGLLVVNYGLPDTGAALWAVGQHFQLTHDAEWLKAVAPTMIRMCDWIIAARRSALAGQTPDAPWRGLIKYRPYCDEPEPAYSFHTDTYLAMGMSQAAAALRGIGLAEAAERIAREAAAYRQDVLRSMDRSVLEHGGVRMLPIFPETRALLKRVNYTGADYYSLVGSMVLETDLIPGGDPRARLITDLLETRNGLCLGACAFQDGIDHAYSYGYWLNCLQRDEVRRVILGLYTSLAYGMSRETYAGVEITHLRTGKNEPTLPHLYSGTQQLLLLRNMLIREDGKELRLGQAIPRPWLEGGKEVRVENAPTLFGPASYSIRSFDGARRMTIELEPPSQRPPERILVRLRHPERRPISQVTINGARSHDFTEDTLALAHLRHHATIQVKFQ
jgi:hypothetical protein